MSILCKEEVDLKLSGFITTNIINEKIYKLGTVNFEMRHPCCVSNKSNVKCIQYDIKHNLVLDGILVY